MLLVFNSLAVFLAGLTNWAWWPGAVLADIDSFAVSEVSSNVLLAGRVWNTLGGSPLVNISWVSTVAVTTSLAVDNNLGVQSNWGQGHISEHDVESISDS